MLGVTRRSLGIIAEPRGFVFGQLKLFSQSGSSSSESSFVSDCSNGPVSITDKLVSSNVRVASKLKYVLIVEKLVNKKK